MLMASGGNDRVDGGAGTDTYNLSATTAGATVNLGSGTSTSTQTGTDTLAGVENVIGSQANDSITGDGNNNNLQGGLGADTISGLGGADTIDGGAGNDSLLGGAGNDSVSGAAGNDIIQGNDGNDTLNGNAGLDTLTGGLGIDLSNGGADADVFDFNDRLEAPVAATAAGRDRVADFTAGVDDLDLSGVDANEFAAAVGDNSFTSLAAGTTFTSTNQLRYQTQGTDLLLQANVNESNGIFQPDMQIQFTGISSLQQADVVM
jgi:Ca2+-binding RTX toxin-like protein